MKEAEVQAAFVDYLLERGWDVITDKADYADVRAKRGAELLVAEVKGDTSSIGTDVDTGYGQILRTMSRHHEATEVALVVPERALTAALRVSLDIRRRLSLGIFVVDDLTNVRPESSDSSL